MLSQTKILVSLALLVLTLGSPHALALPEAVWADQFGGYGGDSPRAVLLDRHGNSFVTGDTQGFAPDPYYSGTKAFLRKYDSAGNHLWTNEFGAGDTWELGTGVAEAPDGTVYLSGHIARQAGLEAVAYLAKFSTDGQLTWESFLGGVGHASGNGVAVGGPDNDVFFAGTTTTTLISPVAGRQDGFLAKYDATSTQLWLREIRTTEFDKVSDVVADSLGNSFVAGSTEGSLVSPNRGRDDLYVQKYDPMGNLLWTHQDGTSFDDTITEIVLDPAGNIYLSGYTQQGSLVGGQPEGYDGFIRKLDSTGVELWTTPLQLGGNDYAGGIALGADGLVYVSGITSRILGTSNRYGFYAVLDPSGSVNDLEVFDQRSELDDVATNPRGDLVYVGTTFASIYAQNLGYVDGFIFKQRVAVPEPGAGGICVIFLLSLYFRRRKQLRV